MPDPFLSQSLKPNHNIILSLGTALSCATNNLALWRSEILPGTH